MDHIEIRITPFARRRIGDLRRVLWSEGLQVEDWQIALCLLAECEQGGTIDPHKLPQAPNTLCGVLKMRSLTDPAAIAIIKKNLPLVNQASEAE